MAIDFTDDERAALIDLLVGAIEHDPFPLSQRFLRLRGILTKLRPTPRLPRDEDEEMSDEAGLGERPRC
jgi:hypothetical protein